MKSRNATCLSLTRLSVVVLALWAGLAQSLTIEYCSSDNTGADGESTSSIYMSNGECQETCGLTTYAFAIVQGENCWCSDYIPADQISTNNCQIDCPGFPDDKCGNPSEGYYGYIALDKKPSGTMGASSSTPAETSTTPASSSPEPVSSAEPAGSDPPSSSYVEPSSPAAATTTSKSKSSTWTPTPMTSTFVKTVSGNVVTQTVIQMPTAPPQKTSPSRKISGGQIAGAIVGGFLALALIVVGTLLFLKRRRNKELAAGGDAEAPRNGPRRNMSTLSKTGLLRSESEKWPASGSNTVRNSMLGLDAFDSTDDAISPISERRNSRPMFYDQRLNPNALMYDHPSGSHSSIITIEDNRDYGRVLGVANPDLDRD